MGKEWNDNFKSKKIKIVQSLKLFGRMRTDKQGGMQIQSY